MTHKNDYSVIAFFPNGTAKKWTYVHKLDEFASRFLDKKHPEWEYMNVYNRRDNVYLRRFYKGNIIPTYL